MIIAPYRGADGWYFDAPELGVFKEALVRGADMLLDAEITGPTATIEFSDAPLPGADIILTRERPGLPAEEFGTWYRDTKYGREVWLCDTLSLYFKDPPERIHLRIRSPLD